MRRELRIIELKDQINALRARLGELPQYRVDSEEPEGNDHAGSNAAEAHEGRQTQRS